MKKPPTRIDASTFQNALDTLALTIVERLKDEWPIALHNDPFAQGLFVLHLRFCRYAYRTECEMFSEERRKDHRWNYQKLVVLPSINRAVLDSLFNVIFTLEDIEARSKWYLRSGWREQKLEFDRIEAEYDGDPEWTEWLHKGSELISQGIDLFGITKDEVIKPKTIQQWPSSGQMPDYQVDPQKRPPNRQFLQYLSDWFYREHSGMAHMSFFGMLKLSPVLSSDDMPKDMRTALERDGLPQLMTSQVLRSAILLLCVVSEVHNHFRFSGGLELKILSVWHSLIPGSPEANDVFRRRYSSMFPATLLNSAPDLR